MATIKVTDETSVELISANPDLTSGFGRYLGKGIAAQIVAGVDLVTQIRRDLGEVDKGERGLGVSFADDIPLSSSGVTLGIAAGARASFGIFNRTGMLLFENTFVGPEEKVPPGTAYVSFTFHPQLEVGVTATSGPLGFGFSAGAEADVRCYRPFDLAAPSLTLADACKTLLEHFAIPADIDDLKTLASQPLGTIASVAGHGHLQIGVTANVAAAFNPLASTAALPIAGKVQLGDTTALSASVTARVTGEFQVRVTNIGENRVHLSYHKMAARQWDVGLEASAGLGLTIGKRELLNMMFGGDTSIAGASEEQLAQAGITTAQMNAIVDALEAGLSRKLSVELSAAFSKLRQHDAAFLYEIDLAALDEQGKQAVAKALTGDLSALTMLEPSLPGHGIKVLQSRLTDLRTKEVRWRINLVGLVNVTHMSKLAQSGTVFHDEESGDVTIVDDVTAERMGAVTDRNKLRRMLYETALLTATYKASGLDVNTDLAAAQSFLFFDKSANRQRMADFLDAVAAVGLMGAGDIDERLGSVDDFGTSTLFMESSYDQRACEQLFLDGDTPRKSAFYQRVGRRALLALVQERDVDNYRRIPLADDGLWQRMLDDGNTFRGVLPSPITGGPGEIVRVSVVSNDFLLITWWADTMATAAARLADVRTALRRLPAGKLETDRDFQHKRDKLRSSMLSALARSRSDFDDPWGLVALVLASGGLAQVSAAVTSPQLQLALPQ